MTFLQKALLGILMCGGFLLWPCSAEIRPPQSATVAAKLTPEAEKIAADLGLGSWMWTTNFGDKQTCRFWRVITLSETNAVQKAILHITADNVYRLYLDGREIGEGGNWRSLTEFDLTWLLTPGSHVLAVEGFNDGLEAGVILGLQISFADAQSIQVLSDDSWRIVPNDVRGWQKKTYADPGWPHAVMVGVIGQMPWWLHPINIIPTSPLRPVELNFWQTGWFLSSVLALCAVALALSLRLATKLAVQTRAQNLLERERVRIARDIHDDLGAEVTQLVLHGEVAQTEFPEGSAARAQFGQMCERARAVSHAVDEVVWAVNSKRDTLRDFVSYLCKYAQNFLNATPIRCRFDVQADLPESGFDLPVRRGLFLAVKESLNNAAKHSEATELFLRIYYEGERVVVVVEDNGRGFDPLQTNADRNGLANMYQRMLEMGGEYRLYTERGAGCRVEFRAPLAPVRSSSRVRRFFGRKSKMDKENASSVNVPGSDYSASQS